MNAYFDRLDAAFAHLESAHPAATLAQAAGAPEQWDLDALDALPPPAAPPRVAEGPGLDPLTPISRYEAPPPVAVTEPIAPPAVAPSSPEARARSLPPKPAALPSLADAFAALLASEQGGPLSDVALTWPATPAAPTPPVPAPPAPVEITEELVEAVTRRVLDRLSDQVVRETVSDIVSKVAERLISEEIARIKDAIE